MRECQAQARDAAKEEREECGARHEARLDVCDALDEDVYDPDLDPADFVDTITNPFAPYAPGSRWVYEGMTAEGLERIEVEVLWETRTILGIEATVVQDRAFLEGELIEDTVDWLAQDVDGNVWYLGEVAQNFEDGKLANLDGSWEAGVDGAKPGLLDEGRPRGGRHLPPGVPAPRGRGHRGSAEPVRGGHRPRRVLHGLPPDQGRTRRSSRRSSNTSSTPPASGWCSR